VASLNIQRDEYLALRTEICQSIVQQHHILLSGYGATAAAAGVVLGSDKVGPKALLVIPIVLLGMVSLWAVECNRMVRASYYIAYFLWPSICPASVGHLGWEAWIRIDRDEGGFRKRQHTFQRFAVLYVPFLLSVTAVVVAASSVWEKPRWLNSIIGFNLILLLIWIYMFVEISKISNLSAVTHQGDYCLAAEDRSTPL